MRPITLSILCALGLGACDGCGRAAPAAVTEAPPQQASVATGVIEGVVRLAEGAVLPSFAAEQMEKHILDHAKRGPWPASCTPPKEQDRRPVREAPDGTLSGLVVAVTGFTQQPVRPQRVHELSIRDCRLQTPTLAAMVGDVVRVRNEVDYPFMPSYGNEPKLRTLTPGQTYDVKLERPGVTPVLCGFTAPCGRTDVVVMMHPLAATTGVDGAFRIADVPADEPLRLSAWHPLFDEAHVEVRVTAGETKRVELVIAPTGGAAAADAGAPPAPPTPAQPTTP